MCTALTLESNDGHHFFGRTMDIPYNFNQSPMVVPEQYALQNRVTEETWHTKYGILGMGMVADGHPLLAEGFNNVGLACAGLNFPHYAVYDEKMDESKENLAPYDLILWILGNFSRVEEVKVELAQICLVNKPFSPQLPLPTLHWMVYDKSGASIVIEKTAEKLAVYENHIGVMANSPEFPWHITNLNQYVGLSSMQPKSAQWHNQTLAPQAEGLGLRGIPGDSYSASRFVRAAYLRGHAGDLETKESTMSTFFHCLDNLSMVSGTVTTKDGMADQTIYSACMDLEEGMYYYKTKKNARISGVTFTEPEVHSGEITLYPYADRQSIHWQN